MAAPTSLRAPGRPRDPAVDREILGATLRLFLEQGYDAMSVEGVAAAAGVGKTTIYRRYPGKRELVVAAVSSIAVEIAPPPDTGDARADLQAFVREALGILRRDGIGFRMIGTLLTTERAEPAFLELFRNTIILPRMAIGAGIVRQGIERGQIRPDVTVDLVLQLIAGAFIARRLVGRPDDDTWLEAVFETIWRGVAAAP